MPFWVPGGTGNTNSTTNWSLTSGGPSGAPVPTAATDAIFDNNSGSGVVTVNSVLNCLNFTTTLFTGTIAGTSGISPRGNFIIGSGVTFNNTGTITFSSVALNKTITTNNKILNNAIVFNGIGGGWVLQDTLTTLKAITLTTGSLDQNNKLITCLSFGSSNSNTRSLTTGGANWNITGTGNIFTINITTGLTLSLAGTSLNVLDTTGASKTINVASLNIPANIVYNESGAGDLTISGGSTWNDLFAPTTTGTAINFTGTNFFRDANFTGYNGTFSGNLNLTRDLICSATMAPSALVVRYVTNGTTSKITSNGNTLVSIYINTIGGSVEAQDNLSLSLELQVDRGEFKPNDKNITIGTLLSANSNVRTISLGSGTWTCNGDWNLSNITNLTFNKDSGNIVMNLTVSNQRFRGGSLTYNNVKFIGAPLVGTVVTESDFAVNKLTVEQTGAGGVSNPYLVEIPGTITLNDMKVIGGSVGSEVMFYGQATGAIRKTSGFISINYVGINKLKTTGAALFYAGANSIDQTPGPDNADWLFINPPSQDQYNSNSFISTSTHFCGNLINP